MKRLFVFALLSLTLAACAGASAPGGAKCQQGVCIKAQVMEPVRGNAPVVLTLTVTSDKDMPELGVSVYHDADAIVEGPQNWEPAAKSGLVWKGGASWKVDAKAKQPSMFTRTIRLPPREGFFTIVVAASTPQVRVADSVGIYVTSAGATVYYSNTPVAITPGTAVPGLPPGMVPATPQPSPTRGVIPTRIPTPTRRPYP